MNPSDVLGFIGTGVMGEPMCRNLAQKSGRRVVAWDLQRAPLERLQAHGVVIAASADALAAQAAALFVCLPGGAQLESLCETALLPAARAGLTIVDLGTSGVGRTRALARRFAERGADYADAPIARTRAAAEAGTLAISVGAAPEVFRRIQPLLACLGTDVTHCGGVGNGQVVKILNNMVLFQTVNALAEALALGRRAGVDPALLFEALAKGSADSFALRNHGMKAMLPGEYPLRAFSVEYAAKDNGYALELGREAGVRLRGAENVAAVFEEARAAGLGGAYYPVIAKIVDR
ncbi:MAG: NAD(P)-dependent oxidoreductase [Betaproteobacteria bacterium]|nr:NAD(P)-dependent oxidoreductase [Betaproteobacteria bacterium]MDH5579147.1 NAD(P)-dependent oxidoreductase [Betaproteobacteria bacterium]